MRLTGETPRQQLTLPHAKEPHAWARERLDGSTGAVHVFIALIGRREQIGMEAVPQRRRLVLPSRWTERSHMRSRRPNQREHRKQASSPNHVVCASACTPGPDRQTSTRLSGLVQHWKRHQG